jgi:predicted transcriptional regulator of viral defense system
MKRPPNRSLQRPTGWGDNVTVMFDNPEQSGDKDVTARLYVLAEGRAGYVTARDAAEAGIVRSTLSHHARPGGRLVHVARGLYRLRDFPTSPHEHIVAGWLRTPPSSDAVVSHESALELDDLSDVIADEVHVTVPRAQRRKPIGGVVIHPTTFPVTKRQRREVLGMPVTTADRTIIDVLRVTGLTEQIETASAEALRRGLTTKRRLRSTAEEFPQTVQRQIAELTR